LKRNLLVVAAVLLLTAGFFVSVARCQDSGEDASTALASARNQMIACYGSARAAETAGANISALTSRLDTAGALFSQAQSAYSGGQFDLAVNLASQSQIVLADFISEASELKAVGDAEANQGFLINVVGSIAATVVVLVGGVIVWFVLKRRYKKSGV
jgi:hypothetical protein